MATKDQLLNADDLPVAKVELDPWLPSQSVHVRTITAHDVEVRLPELIGDADNEQPDIAARLAAFFLCDESGNRMFPDEDREAFEREVLRLAGKNPQLLKRIVEAGNAHNSIGKEFVEQTAKNSEPSQD